MTNEKLFALGKPCFYVVQTDESAFENLYLQLVQRNTGSVIRKVRGKKSSTLQDFFNEIAASLQFPYYFGENWNAFEECITDLDWIEGDAYLLMISNANSLLNNADSEDFRILLQTLARANEEWLTPNTYIPRDRQPTPFHVLFQCTTDDISAFSQRLASFNTAFEQLVDID